MSCVGNFTAFSIDCYIFFHGREAVVLSHGIIKKGSEVPVKEIEIALKRKIIFEKDPVAHSYSENI